MLGWTPGAFWRSTVWDARDAYDGYALAHGLRPPESDALSAEEIGQLRARIAQEQRKERLQHGNN